MRGRQISGMTNFTHKKELFAFCSESCYSHANTMVKRFSDDKNYQKTSACGIACQSVFFVGSPTMLSE